MYDLEKASQIAYIQTAVILQQNISGDTPEYLMLIRGQNQSIDRSCPIQYRGKIQIHPIIIGFDPPRH
jgi:hypothetical protein